MTVSYEKLMVIYHFYERDRHSTIMNMLDYFCQDDERDNVIFRKQVHEAINILEDMTEEAFQALDSYECEADIY